MGKIYTYDIGTRLRTTLNSDLTGYSSVNYRIKMPGGSILTKACTVEDAGEWIIYYDTISNDLSEAGQYTIQARIVFSGGDQHESETRYFEVYDSFT